MNDPPRDADRQRAGHKPVIGLLGAPGAGKSLVAGQLAALGCAVVDADALAREALGEPAVKEQLARWWGPDVLDERGEVDRSALARIVFADRAALEQLESLTHPRVRQKRAFLHEQYQARPAVKAIVEDTPLLIESGLDADCDAVIFVEASLPTRVARVARRGWSAEELDRREKNQTPLDIKRKRADYVVNNDADEASTQDQVRRVLSRIITHEPDQLA